MNVIYTVSTVLSFFRGLTVVFRILAPMIVAFIYSVIFYRQTQQQFTQEMVAENSTGKDRDRFLDTKNLVFINF